MNNKVLYFGLGVGVGFIVSKFHIKDRVLSFIKSKLRKETFDEITKEEPSKPIEDEKIYDTEKDEEPETTIDTDDTIKKINDLNAELEYLAEEDNFNKEIKENAKRKYVRKVQIIPEEEFGEKENYTKEIYYYDPEKNIFKDENFYTMNLPWDKMFGKNFVKNRAKYEEGICHIRNDNNKRYYEVIDLDKEGD